MGDILKLLFVFASLANVAADPMPRGSMMAADNLQIPRRYVGEWQRDRDFCGRGGPMIDRGSGLRIYPGHVDGLSLLGVYFFSDSNATVIEVGGDGHPPRFIELDVSGDRMTLGVREEGGKLVQLRRCPIGIKDGEQNDPWLARAKNACEAGDADAFLSAFLRSEAVQRRSIARKIRIVEFGQTYHLGGRYYRPPVFAQTGAGFALGGSIDNEPAELKFVLTLEPEGSFSVSWQRLMHVVPVGINDQPTSFAETYGPTGKLLFRRAKGCWHLVSEALSYGE